MNDEVGFGCNTATIIIDRQPLTTQEYWAIVDLICAAEDILHEARRGRREARVPLYSLDDLEQAIENFNRRMS